MSLLQKDQLLDGYRLIRLIGQGGFGEVWLCQSQAMGDYRALKFIPAGDADLLEKEHHALGEYRKAAAQLRSPNLMPIEHVNRHEHGLFCVMPLADGNAGLDPADESWRPWTLGSLLRARAAEPTWLSSGEIVLLILPLLGALHTLSAAGLVHRDVKPENILFFDGQLCLSDISLLGVDSVENTRRGTPGYAAPSWYVGGHVDMYGAAATMYTLLTGNSPDRMGRSAFNWPPQGEASMSESERAEWKWLHAVIRRAVEERAGERYLDFQSMAAAVSGMEVATPVDPRAGRHRWPSVLLVLVSVAASTGWMISKSHNDDPAKDRATIAHDTRYDSTEPQAVASPVLVPSNRAPKIVESGGAFPSLRSKLIGAIPQILHDAAPGEENRLDIGDYASRAEIRQAYERRDYEGALTSLDSLLKASPGLREKQSCSLLRALLLKRSNRLPEMEAEIARVSVQPGTLAGSDGRELHHVIERVVLWEALDRFAAAEKFLTASLAEVLAELDQYPPGTAETLFNLRARMKILAADYAGALEDERSALALPVEHSRAYRGKEIGHLTAAEVERIRLNSIVADWEWLEQEFPGYDAYLGANGSPEPQPDLRRLDED